MIKLSDDYRIRPYDEVQWVLEYRRPHSRTKAGAERWNILAYCRTKVGLETRFVLAYSGTYNVPKAHYALTSERTPY